MADEQHARIVVEQFNADTVASVRSPVRVLHAADIGVMVMMIWGEMDVRWRQNACNDRSRDDYRRQYDPSHSPRKHARDYVA